MTTPFWRVPERRIGWQYPLAFVIFVLAQGLGVLAGLGANHAAHGSATPGDPSLTPWPGLAVMLAVQAVVSVALFVAVIRLLARRPVHEFGREGARREFLAGLAVGTGLMLVVTGVLAALGVYRVSGASLNTGIAVGLMTGVGAAFAEEIVFRGFLLRLLDAWLGTWPALTLSAALFGGVHLANPGATPLGAVAIMIEAGIMLGAAYLLTRRLWLPISIHLAWNFVQGGIFGGNVSGTDLPSPHGLFTSTVTGPDWLSGGTTGIEGSVVTVVAGAATAIWMLREAGRRGHLTPARLTPTARRSAH
ncbi:MAG: CPBP family intramembrane glutamic endopeptidase [Kineosporiaceae bacterium]